MTTTSDIEVDWPAGATELESLAKGVSASFAVRLEDARAMQRLLPPSSFRVARRAGRVEGGLTLFEMEQFFGGRPVPMGGVGSVAISPRARGHGVAKALMRAVLEELRARGLVLSTLYPAAQGLYRSLGYEQAGSYIRYRLPIAHLTLRERQLEVREVTLADKALLEALYLTRAEVTPGHLKRPDALWQRLLERPGEEPQAFVVSSDRGPEGYVVYTLRRGDASLVYDVVVKDLVASTPAALRRLLTLVADHRSLGRDLLWCGGPGDAVLLTVDDQVHSIDSHWRWMLRLVDAKAAIGARGFPLGARGAVHLELVDDVLANNHGRFVLDVHEGQGQLKPGGNGDVRMGIGALASLYAGDASPWTLVRCGLAEIPLEDARVLTELFAGDAPWMPDFF